MPKSGPKPKEKAGALAKLAKRIGFMAARGVGSKMRKLTGFAIERGP